MRIAGPVSDRGNSAVERAVAGPADAERRLQPKLGKGRELTTEKCLAVIQVSPVDAIVPLGGLPRELKYRLQGVGRLIIARALERGDLGRKDRAVDDEAPGNGPRLGPSMPIDALKAL